MKTLLLITLLAVSVSAKSQVKFKGLYVGAQTITAVNFKERLSHSVYLIGLVGYKKFTFNTQFIVPVFVRDHPFIKFGIDYKIL